MFWGHTGAFPYPIAALWQLCSRRGLALGLVLSCWWTLDSYLHFMETVRDVQNCSQACKVLIRTMVAQVFICF